MLRLQGRNDCSQAVALSGNRTTSDASLLCGDLPSSFVPQTNQTRFLNQSHFRCTFQRLLALALCSTLIMLRSIGLRHGPDSTSRQDDNRSAGLKSVRHITCVGTARASPSSFVRKRSFSIHASSSHDADQQKENAKSRSSSRDQVLSVPQGFFLYKCVRSQHKSSSLFWRGR